MVSDAGDAVRGGSRRCNGGVAASRTQWRRLRRAIPPREHIEWRSRCL